MSQTRKTTVITTNNNTKKQSKPRRRNKTKLSPNVKAPSASSRTMETLQSRSFITPPRREFVMSVPGTTLPYVVHKKLRLNPGDPEFSQWASNLARCFESYRFRKLKIIYVPRCGSTTSGFVAISPDCNPHDPDPSTEQECYANYKAKDDTPWKEFSVVFDKEMLNKRKSFFCRRDGEIPVGADIDLYDTGNLFICGGGQTDGTFKGQIWIEYQLEFMTPEAGQKSLVPTMLSFNNTGVSTTSPLGSMTALSGTQVGNILESITNDGTGSVLKFAKDFHGMLEMKHNAASGITGFGTISSLGSALVNMTEGTWSGNVAGSYNATAGFLNSLIKASKGDEIRLTGPGLAQPSGVSFSLLTCSL